MIGRFEVCVLRFLNAHMHVSSNDHMYVYSWSNVCILSCLNAYK